MLVGLFIWLVHPLLSNVHEHLVRATTQTEYIALSLGADEVERCRIMLRQLGMAEYMEAPTIVFSDNKAAIGTSDMTFNGKSTKSLDLHFHIFILRVI